MAVPGSRRFALALTALGLATALFALTPLGQDAPFAPHPARACGGPDSYQSISLVDRMPATLDGLLELVTTVNDGFEYGSRPELRFYHPFVAEEEASRRKAGDGTATGGGATGTAGTATATVGTATGTAGGATGNEAAVSEPDMALRVRDFDAALKDHNAAGAGIAARSIVTDILNMPAVAADDYQTLMARAVEYLELQPYVKDLKPEQWSSYFLQLETSKNARSSLSSETTAVHLTAWETVIKARPPTDLTDSASYPPPFRDALQVRRLERSRVDALIQATPQHPRMASLRFVSIQQRMMATLPDGWELSAEQRATALPEPKWQELEQLVDRWLTDYPGHPLADLVRLSKVRLAYFEGRARPAWDTLLAMYPRHKERLLNEMHYLLLRQFVDPEAFAHITDPVLVTALMPYTPFTPERIAAWWKLSEQNISRPWAINMQERLLAYAAQNAKPGQLIDGFPATPRNPTPLWGKLRYVALARAQRWEEAEKQVLSLPTELEQVVLAVSYYLLRDDPARAAEVKGLPGELRQYLIEVRADDAGLERLSASRDAGLRREALLARGVRLTAQGRWADAAALVKGVDPGHAALWTKAAALAGDTTPEGPLKLARFFKANNGKLFYGQDKVMYRTLTWNLNQSDPAAATPTTPADPGRELTTRHLTQSTEMWLALQAYIRWLNDATPSPAMVTVTREADLCYNWLMNWDSTNSSFWADFLKDRPEVAQLRAAGERAKGKKG